MIIQTIFRIYDHPIRKTRLMYLPGITRAYSASTSAGGLCINPMQWVRQQSGWWVWLYAIAPILFCPHDLIIKIFKNALFH